MERVKEGGRGAYFIFGSLPIFRASKTPKIPFFTPKPHGNACYAGYAICQTLNYKYTENVTDIVFFILWNTSFRFVEFEGNNKYAKKGITSPWNALTL